MGTAELLGCVYWAHRNASKYEDSILECRTSLGDQQLNMMLRKEPDLHLRFPHMHIYISSFNNLGPHIRSVLKGLYIIPKNQFLYGENEWGFFASCYLPLCFYKVLICKDAVAIVYDSSPLLLIPVSLWIYSSILINSVPLPQKKSSKENSVKSLEAQSVRQGERVYSRVECGWRFWSNPVSGHSQSQSWFVYLLNEKKKPSTNVLGNICR